MVCMVRMASAQGFAWAVWFVHKCIVGFCDPTFMQGSVLVGKRGGPSRPVLCVDYESEVGLPTRKVLWRPQVAEHGTFHAWE
jgi:hypothetical protein